MDDLEVPLFQKTTILGYIYLRISWMLMGVANQFLTAGTQLVACKPATIALELSPQLVLSFADGGNENDIYIYIYVHLYTWIHSCILFLYIYIYRPDDTYIYISLSIICIYVHDLYVCTYFPYMHSCTFMLGIVCPGHTCSSKLPSTYDHT